jgi:hypothetical protein
MDLSWEPEPTGGGEPAVRAWRWVITLLSGSGPESGVGREDEMGGDEQMDRKALVFLRDGRVRVADAEDVNLLPHAVEIGLRRRDPASRTSDLDVFPWGEVARVYVGIAVLRQGQWLPEIDVAEKTWQKGDLI